jgi:hypothetical protein
VEREGLGLSASWGWQKEGEGRRESRASLALEASGRAVEAVEVVAVGDTVAAG